jgi:hypothetical protein
MEGTRAVQISVLHQLARRYISISRAFQQDRELAVPSIMLGIIG